MLLNFKSIQTKIAVVAGISLLASAAILVTFGFISSKNNQQVVSEQVSGLVDQNTRESLKNLAGAEAGKIQAKFDVALDAARTMAHTFVLSKDTAENLPLGRDQINAILLSVLKNNPDFNGTYSCWEPDALDGQDAQHRTGKNGNNAITGRFTPYWNRDAKGNIAVQPLVEYDTLDKHPNGVMKGGWYIGPHDTGTESVLDPFPYIVQGKQVWLTTLSVPISLRGKFYGVAGTDYNLAFVQKLAEEADKQLFEGKGEVAIVSNMGLIVGDSENPGMVGQAFNTLVGDGAAEQLANIQSGAANVSVNDKSGQMLAFAPINLGRTGKPWAVMIKVPTAVVMAKAHALDQELSSRATHNTILQVAVGVGVALAGILFLWFAAGTISRPIRHAADAARKLSQGDTSAVMSVKTRDETGQLMTAMQGMSDSIKRLISDTTMLSQAAIEGELATRADGQQHQGDFRKVVEGVNATLDAVITPLNVAANYVDRISHGDIPPLITDNYNGDFNKIKHNLNTCIEAIQNLVSEAGHLERAAVAGQLSVRGDLKRYQGEFRRVVEGFNATLDAVITPLNVAATYVDHLAKGQFPPKITDAYEGDFNIIKNNLNDCIDAVKGLVRDASMLANAAADGKLSVRADVSQHQGDYRKVIEGINATLDNVIGPLNVAADYVARIAQGDIPPVIIEQYAGDFAILKNNINTCVLAINNLVKDAEMLADAARQGQVTVRADANQHSGDFRKIVQGVNATLEMIVTPIVTVKEATEAINTAAQEIAQGNVDLSQRTEEQAASLEETASSMEQLAATVKQNADNAMHANTLATAASGVAVKGGAVVADVVKTMASINESAHKIEAIITVIDGIAFQTNILALNAAVEAARAGEQGRGFAVVAGEVRTLAQRSASAAKEIKELITDSVDKTMAGTQLVEHAGTTMSELVNSVKRVSDIMSEIASASSEQSEGIAQVNKAVTQMDEVTQQNAALVEEAAAAAESLMMQAEELKSAVSVFKLDQSASGGAVRLTAVSKKNTPRAQPVRALANSKPVLAAINTEGDDWQTF
ncbi:methyl-accepting chemotaxis protein [Methylovorus menthalis]|uniref:methyl-accepting chemotaxis protein n=1 Tax=Methylovorus menthalis TaxID=1002227 RepID=UPI001E546F19|nr:methyl-accepting chemotaxis protein [Methylovorus menthalis]MCB4811813.1 methyl-accepting chemotaxis protein [Methylovorus menthalis]